MPELETLFFLLVAVTAFVLLAHRLKQPYPILLVIGGLILSFIPRLPHIDLKAEIVLFVFLPPLLYVDSLHTSWHAFKKYLRPILLLAIGLVLLTMVAVACVAHLLMPMISWQVAFVLGAIVAPTDTVAIGAIAERLHLPRNITTILQGESLVNDATAIVAYRIALGVATGATVFTPMGALGNFSLVAAGGIAIGLAIGWGVGHLRHWLPNYPPAVNTISLLTPLAAYLPAESLHVSGVLAVVACGIYLGRLGPRTVTSGTRLQATGMWEMITYLLNGLLFLLVGMQMHQIVGQLTPEDSPILLVWVAFAISVTLLAVRMAWVFAATYLPHLLPAYRRGSPWKPSWQGVTVVGMSGLRGAISLAVAAALPETINGAGSGTLPFPLRSAILFVTFCVILFTLVGQGLSLPPLIRLLKVHGGDEERQEEFKARKAALDAAIEILDGHDVRDDVPEGVRNEMRRAYTLRRKRLKAHIIAGRSESHEEAAEDEVDDADNAEEIVGMARGYYRLRRELVQAERDAVVSLRDKGEIDDGVLRRIQNEIDLEETRLGAVSL